MSESSSERSSRSRANDTSETYLDSSRLVSVEQVHHPSACRTGIGARVREKSMKTLSAGRIRGIGFEDVCLQPADERLDVDRSRIVAIAVPRCCKMSP